MALHNFVWEAEGSDVALLGSFDDWKHPGRPMIKGKQGFCIRISLPAGQYQYKFLVDGVYRHDPHKKVVPDEHGGFNNIYEVNQNATVVHSENVEPITNAFTGIQGHSNLSQQQSFPVLSTHLTSHTVKITCLSESITQNVLTKLVEEHGKLVNKPFIRGSTNRYAWVNFESKEGAESAVAHLNGSFLDSRNITASLKQPSNTPTDQQLPLSQKVLKPVVVDGPQKKKRQPSNTPQLAHQLSQKVLKPVVDGSYKPQKETKLLKQPLNTPTDQQLPLSKKVLKPVIVDGPQKKKRQPSNSQTDQQLAHSLSQKVLKPVVDGSYIPQKKKKLYQHTSLATIDAEASNKHKTEYNQLNELRSVDDLLLRIKYEQESTRTKCEEKISQLKQEQTQIQIPKKCPLPLFQVLQERKTSIALDMSEIQCRQSEFNTACEKLCKIVCSLSSPPPELVEKRLSCECARYNKGLPIYSHRQQIMEIIRDHQVSILTAETGSGKSTQLVQYIYEDGFASAGVIVCTQPRKVAAISLSTYVSSEMFASPGTIVGYKTGIHGSYSEDTDVLYVTDHTLLNECVEDPTFSKYSCLIVDEAHERNLNTDVLLAFIKRCLPRRPDLRVVITSATIDPKNFLQYFGQDCPVKTVPGRLFPVDVTYSPITTSQSLQRGMPVYAAEAIDCAYALHKNEPPGDILIFLTSPSEVEHACQILEMRTKSTACVLPLHGKLQPEDQQKVFKDYPQRKIIFSTNVAETSITILGVKYIVDSGVVKELCFDAKKNMNSLEVRPISKSSAEQRKGRAGRTSAGKCYRLYSEDTYKSMSERMVPEILRVSLAGTVLKLHELGITDVLGFDFIEKPEEAALIYAVETLEFLGAVCNGRLTNIGRSMAAFPVDPRLAKIILDGFVEKAGSEAIAMAAISSLASTIFFRGGTDQSKEQSDLLKSTFCVPEGDQLTDFSAYCQWVSHSRQERNAWCVNNSINAKSMRIVDETIKDLTAIVKKQLKVPIATSTLSFERAIDKLTKLFFRSFANNLCVFLGHEKIGYFNPNLPDEKLVIFPGSSLCKLNTQPKLLIYEKTLRTSQHFLLQVLPVREEWVEEALESGLIRHHPMKCEQFTNLEVSPFVVEHLGTYVLDTVVRNQRSLFDHPTFTTLNRVQIDASQRNGTLKVFVQKRFRTLVQKHLEHYISQKKLELNMFRSEAGVTVDGDNVRVLVGSGGCTVNILMPHQYRCLVAKGPVAGNWNEELANTLSGCGAIQKQVFTKEKLIVTFYDSNDAEKACKVLTPTGVCILPLLPRKEDRFNVSYLTMKMEWTRRERKNFVNLDFRTPLIVSTIFTHLSNSGAAIAGMVMRFQISKHNECHVFTSNVPPQIPEEAIRNEFDRILTPLGYLRGSYEVQFAYSKAFETTTEKHEELQGNLHSLLDPIAKGKFNLKLLMPEHYHKFFVAFVNFTSIDEGMTAIDTLSNARINYKPVRISRILSSSIKYSPTLYAAVQKSVYEATESVKADYRSVKVTNPKKGDVVIVKVESSNPTEFVAALKALNSVVQPDVIDCSNQLPFEYMRSKRCEEDIKRIEEISLTVIRRDFRLKCIKIYGIKENTTKAKAEFDKSLSFGIGINYYEVELKRSGRPPGLLKFLITTFGIDLRLLMTQPGIEMVRVDIRKQILILFASDTGYEVLMDIIEQFCRENSTNTPSVHSLAGDVMCCACYTPIDDAESIYRLEDCGHAYHCECIEAQLTPNTITIPIQCAAEGCSRPFVWQDFENLKSKGKLNLQTIVTESVRAYVSANKDQVHNCPTPDCGMVYTVTEQGRCFLCIHCGVLTCTNCHKPFHCGLTCAQNESSGIADEGLTTWLQGDSANRKLCPKCSTPIEKDGGCAHVACKSCKSHICWHCLAFFSSSGECYGHLSQTHGGFM